MKFSLPWAGTNSSNYTPVLPQENGNDFEEEQGLLSEKNHPAPQSSSIHGFLLQVLIILACSMFLTSIALVIILKVDSKIVRNAWNRQPLKPNLPYGSPSIPIEYELSRFGPSEIFTERQSDRSDEAWEALAGPNESTDQGFIVIPNAREFGLPPGSQTVEGEKYGISMFHQLHCLGAIRQTFWQLMDGELDPVAFEALDGDTTSNTYVPHGHGLWHIKHCFNYVRHALQCYGDTSIEVPTLFNGQQIFIGWNTTHQCRRYEPIWDYALKHG